MARLLIRNVEPELKLWLEVRAKRNGRSLEEEAYEIIRIALDKEEEDAAVAAPDARAK
jgi:plasmid stability protein